MAHEFESGFFVARGAWHGLGTVLQSSPATKEAIIQAGLNWQVLEQPFYQQGTESAKAVLRKRLVRDCDQKVLGTVDHDYTPLQNQDAFRWFDPLIEKGGMVLEAAGSLQGGKRIWVLAKVAKTEARVGLHDLIRPYLLLHNSHDGSTAVWLQFTPVRVVCMNTLAGATSRRFQDLWKKQAACIPHTASLEEQMAKVQSLIDTNKLEFQMSIEDYQAMADKEVNSELLSTYLGSVLGTTRPQLRPEWAQMVNNFEHGQGNSGKTLWNAYNAVTKWIDHQQGTSDERRLWSTWFGTGAVLREKAHQEAIALIQNRATDQSTQDARKEAVREQLKRATLISDLQTGIDQLNSGKYTTYDEETATTLAGRVKSQARIGKQSAGT